MNRDPYLVRRNDNYYFHRAIPARIKQHIDMPSPQHTIELRAIDNVLDRPLEQGREDKPAASELSSIAIDIDNQDSKLDLQPNETIERQLRAEQIAQQDDNLLNPEAKQEL